jgi:hypothetical protein
MRFKNKSASSRQLWFGVCLQNRADNDSHTVTCAAYRLPCATMDTRRTNSRLDNWQRRSFRISQRVAKLNRSARMADRAEDVGEGRDKGVIVGRPPYLGR